jgi:hypothetical protein
MDFHMDRILSWRKHALPIGLIVLASALVFLPFAGRLGFYRDDWYMLWSASLRGPASIIELFSIDRPFMGYTYGLTYRLLGNSTLAWQLYAIALKTLSAIAVYGIVRLIWPRQARAAAAAALLFLFYPGFLGQPNAATMTNQLLSLTSGLWSIWLSGLALTAPRRVARSRRILCALLLALLNFLLYEYMIGLEVLRFWVLWLVPQQTEAFDVRGRVRRFAADFWPYAGLILIFLVWRLGFFKSERVGADQFSILAAAIENPRAALVSFSLESVLDLLETVVLAWGVPFAYFAAVERALLVGTALFVGAAVTALVLLVMALDQRIYGTAQHGAGRNSAAWVCLAGGCRSMAPCSLFWWLVEMSILLEVLTGTRSTPAQQLQLFW